MNIPLFVPLIWGAALGVITLLGFGGYALFSKDPEKNKLGVLGMQSAGKTRFLSHLRNITFRDKGTQIEKYDPFIHKYDGKVIHIDAGVDIGGGSMYRNEYNRIIKKSNVIFYFFDISKYLDDSPYEGVGYRRACNSRIEHINSAGKELKNSIVVVGTHIDLCTKNEAKVKSEFLKLVKDKYYYSVLKNTELIDLTNTNQLNEFIKKVFK